MLLAARRSFWSYQRLKLKKMMLLAAGRSFWSYQR